MVNDHPTVKPIKLMQYLCQLIVPPAGTVLDPFCGSGSTLVAATRLQMKGIGMDIDSHYCEIAKMKLTRTGLFN
jgi:site-specific DNA-methyltransferase (adenine-specific)